MDKIYIKNSDNHVKNGVHQNSWPNQTYPVIHSTFKTTVYHRTAHFARSWALHSQA